MSRYILAAALLATSAASLAAIDPNIRAVQPDHINDYWVMTNTSFYAALYGGERQSLKQRLGVIPPRTSEEGYAPTITGQATLQ